MPYNNAPIIPSEEISGSSALPLARVKKIIAQDDEIAQCSNGAAFAISVATEHFIRYLTEQAYNVVKSERKPRRNIAYKDVGLYYSFPSEKPNVLLTNTQATAVSRIDNLEFLSDTVPKTKTYRQIKEDAAREEQAAAAATAAAAAKAGPPTNGTHGETTSAKPIQQMMQRQPMTNGDRANGAAAISAEQQAESMPPSPLVHRTATQNGHNHAQGDRDVNMTG